MIPSSMQDSNTLRIALLGNMNNNHFAFARYLRDEGFNCELLLLANEEDHFNPKSDTYNLEFMPWVKRVTWGAEHQLSSISAKVIQADVDKYDILIGCGLTPAFLYKAGYSLDIMIPYGWDIWEATRFRIAAPHYILKFLFAIYLQRKGLSRVKTFHYKGDSDVYGRRIRNFNPNAHFWNFGIPIVYHKQYSDQSIGLGAHWFNDFQEIRRNVDFMLVAHGRHVWGSANNLNVKGNDILIEGWSIFLDRNPMTKSKLVLIEYGEDVVKSKRYIAELDIQDSVCWFPKMYRKDLMPGLLMADLVAADFIHSWIGGGVIYEALVAGKPLLMNSVEHKEPTRSKDLYSIYNASTAEQIADRLQDCIDEPERGRKMGIAGHKWYQENIVEKAIAKYTEYFEHRAKALGKTAR